MIGLKGSTSEALRLFRKITRLRSPEQGRERRESVHVDKVNHLALTDYCQAFPFNKKMRKKTDQLGIWLWPDS